MNDFYLQYFKRLNHISLTAIKFDGLCLTCFVQLVNEVQCEKLNITLSIQHGQKARGIQGFSYNNKCFLFSIYRMSV